MILMNIDYSGEIIYNSLFVSVYHEPTKLMAEGISVIDMRHLLGVETMPSEKLICCIWVS